MKTILKAVAGVAGIGICSIWYFKVFRKAKRRKLTILKQMLNREKKTAGGLEKMQ